MSFRWYGAHDPVTLSNIRQIPGVTGIVSSLYHLAPGTVWPVDEIHNLQAEIESAGFRLSVIESVPVHEDIKMGLPTRDVWIENYCETLRHLAQVGVDTVCYNFMPLFDWLRTTLALRLPDGSTTLAYEDVQVDEAALLSGELRLPAWNIDTDRARLQEMLAFYRALTEEDVWDHLAYFVEAVAPVAQAVGIRLAIHPDDPPWSVLGIPRIMVNRDSLARLLRISDVQANGICLCTGSLGSRADNDVPALMREFGGMGRVHFVHLRNVKRTGNHSFYESGHLSADGSVDMYDMVRAMAGVGFTGPARPDHGRMIWGETGNPGYGLYDRALGAMYLQGLWEAAKRTADNPDWT